VHLTILIPMRKLLPILCLTFSLSPFLAMAFLAPPAAALSQSGDPSQRPTLNRHPSSDPQATPSPTPPSTPTPAPVPSPVGTPSASPTAEPAQPERSAESAKPAYPDLLPHYTYDSKSGLDMLETSVEKHGDVRVIELNYAGSGGDRVPAYLLIPSGKGPFAGIVWGHWLKPGSHFGDKEEFLEEALALARSGVVSVLVDAPQVRHGFVTEKDPLEAMRQQGEAGGHQVIDLRRAVDLLFLRADVDRKRIAYVGHGWDAHTGAILAGVETRIDSFVLMVGGYSTEETFFASKDPKILAQRKQLTDDTLHEYFREYAWDDPIYFLGHTDREGIFLQFASADSVSREQAQKYLDMFSSKDKKMEFYDGGPALNAAARLDRDRWLQKQLGLKKLDEKELGDIPQVK
jgi:dienelactone hydrolase